MRKGWVKVLLIIIPYIVVVGVFQLLGYKILGLDIENARSKTNFQTFIIKVFDLIGTLLLLWTFMKFVDKEKFIQLGFHLKNRSKDIFYGLVFGFAIMTLGYFFLAFSGNIFYSEMTFSTDGLLSSLGLFTVVAIVEEVLVRGYILKNFMQSFNKYIALILSSLLFSLMHFFNPHTDFFSLFNIFLAGIFLGISYIYTKNLWFPIALHFSWNFFQSFYGFNVSGQDFYSLIHFTMKDLNMLNGGNFGFEGSYLSTLAMMICVGAVAYYYEKVEPRAKNQESRGKITDY